MVRSHLNQSHHAVPESSESRHRTSNRLHNRRSPAQHGKPQRHHLSWQTPTERRGHDNTSSRSHARVDNRGSGNRSARNRAGDFRSATNSNRRPKWRRNKPKKRRRGRGGAPPLSGGNIAPVVGSNRQPIASMRMRMDDYVAPRTGRLLPLAKSNDIEHVVARARREASTRTKDTFWTKKLLDAETSHPSNRWAHSGFKEMYREELGYSEMEEERSLRRSPGRSGIAREDFGTKKVRPKSPTKQRVSDDRSRGVAPKSKNDSRIKTPQSPGRKMSKSRSRSRSVRYRTRTKQVIPKGKNPNSLRKNISQGRSDKRRFSRSLSRSLSSISSRFDSHSDSRSYSSYTSSPSSSDTSSSFSSSSSVSLRSYSRRRRRRSYSRSWSRSRSRSRSRSMKRLPPPKIKTASLSKAVQSVHLNKEKSKKPLTKTVNNTSELKNMYSSGAVATTTTTASAAATTVKTKAKAPRSPQDMSHMHRHSSTIPPTPEPIPPPLVDFYEKEIPPDKNLNSPYIEPVDTIQYKNDVRRVAESSSTLKTAHVLINVASQQREASDLVAAARSEGEQSNTESSSGDEDIPMKMTLSERFGKLAQLSSQRQEYEGVRMKIVREGGQDKKVYLEGGSRSPSPVGRRSNVAHERWLREHKAEYDEYEERYGEFREWDPHRDLPRELPPNWDDVNVRYRYYKESGYFGERSITMEDYLKWEEWWYRYRDWLEKYGGVQEENIKYGGPYGGYVDVPRGAARDRWIRRENQREKDDRKRLRY